jgi:hypothetical protein
MMMVVVVVIVTIVHTATGPLPLQVAPGVLSLMTTLAVPVTLVSQFLLCLAHAFFAFVPCQGRHGRTKQQAAAQQAGNQAIVPKHIVHLLS